MPVLDGNFEAFVTNLGKYNEGMLVGEWVKLPTTEEEMQKVFERIGIGKQDEFGQPYEEWFITDYECPIYGVQKMLGEYENLDKLNYLAALIDELSLSDQEKLVAIMNSGCDRVSDIDDLIKDVAFYVFPETLLTVCCLTLQNGFNVTGESACASPANFNQQIGEKVAFDNAKQKIWPLAGYLLKQKLYEQENS